MKEKQAKKVFANYNPQDAVTRCPNGRAHVRKLLDIYAKAAVNLYGVISKAEFAEIFNSQNIEQTNADEVFTLLLPLVLKNKWYCFYKDYIVHYWAIDDFDYADYWLGEQGDKPRFIPERDEFMRYEDPYHECETQKPYWIKLLEFIGKEWPDNNLRYRFYQELKEISVLALGVKAISELFDRFGLIFDSDKQAQAFFDLLTEAQNNTRLWANKGFSPNGLHKYLKKNFPRIGPPPVIMQKRVTIGLNDPCPCGSGKKYKKCCRLIEQAKTAQLSRSECMLFYETWYGLMGFINEEQQIIDEEIEPVYPNPVSDEQVYKVREVLWKNPGLIDDYLGAVHLPEEKTELLKSWRDHHIKGMFFLVDYKPEYAVVVGSNEQKEDRLYGITGISRPLSDAMQRELPMQLETVLLPFKEKIIYDGFMRSLPIRFGEGAKQTFQEIYEKALEHGIITSLT